MSEEAATATAETTEQTTEATTEQTATTEQAGSVLGDGASTATEQTATQTTEAPAWMNSLPDELKGSESLSKFKAQNEQEALAQLAKGYVNLESKLGGKTVKVPGQNASAEEWAEFRSAVGVPESADQYQMPTEGIPEGVEFDENLTTEFKQKAHELGLTPQQAAALYRWQAEKTGESLQSQQQQMEQKRQESEAELKKEFGNAFQEKLDLAKKAVQRFGGEDLVTALNETGAGNDPRIIKAMAQIGQAIASDEIIGEGASKTFGLSPAEAKSRINEKEADSEFMAKVSDRNAAGHEQANKELYRLYKAAYPEE